MFDANELQLVMAMPLDERVQRAVKLLQLYEPDDGYYLAFSGGKDSCACKKLLQLAGVTFEAWYNNVTIDPPELVRFIKQHHSDVKWNQPKHGNMMHRVASAPKVPPTRSVRWCCSEYKEMGGHGRVKVFGVRAAESKGRMHNWREMARDMHGNLSICPIVFWSHDQLWEFIRSYKVPYCSLYDEGFDRIGCVLCPLASLSNQAKEAARWPKYEENWKKAVIANWERWKDIPNTKTGEPRYQAKFATGEDFWKWWRYGKPPLDPTYQDCQSMILWTNDDEL